MPRLIAVLIGSLISLLPSLAFARAEDVPRFDIAHTCTEARAFAGDDKDLAYRGCLKDENDARAELKRKWSHFKLQDRRDCVEQGAAPMPSYVEILTCLEMTDEARTLYNPDGTARVRPKSQNANPALSGPPPALPSDDSLNPALSAPPSTLPAGDSLLPASPSAPTAPGVPPSSATPPELDPVPEADPRTPDLGGARN